MVPTPPTRGPAVRAHKVLVADDQASVRGMLAAILRGFGCEVLTAKDGAQAVQLFREHRPNCVLLDAHMPVMDGFQACAEIKALSADRFTPVLLVTSDRSAEAQVRGAQAGVDEQLVKPVTPELLQAKVKALDQIANLHRQLADQHEELLAHRASVQREHELALALIQHVIHRGVACANVRRLETPADDFHGDIVFTAWGPDARQFVLVGDFTGHGLRAALGAMPAADVFYSMTRAGFGTSDLVRELNKRFHSLLPPEMFLCACLLEIDHRAGVLTAWNGGLPPAIVRDDRGVLQEIESTHLPIGVLAPHEFDDSVVTLRVASGDRIYAFSDGVIEQENSSGERFELERLKSMLSNIDGADRIFDALRSSLDAHQHEQAQGDDITLIEVLVDSSLSPQFATADAGRGAASEALTWSLDLKLEGRALRLVDPRPVLLRALHELQGLEAHREPLHVVLSELYGHALDYGVLNCDPELKRSPEGFAEYAAEHARRHALLDSGHVAIHLRHQPTPTGGLLEIAVDDSGPCFGVRDPRPASDARGRESDLARSYCESFELAGQGGESRAVYEWREHPNASEDAA